MKKLILRGKIQENGIPKIQGLFKFKDQYGIPISMIYEIVVLELKLEIDWIEILADAARQNKFDSLLNEVKMLVSDIDFKLIKYLFGSIIMDDRFCGDTDTLKERAELLHKIIWR